ncbi:hypothetical protein [Sneathiella glossodoripedis]|uniref:hypothetical protein n=1 Tax=Sneathiella glossodoripedis TaxID=418853 RepID=UPI00046F734C|nr:hypothetical protein [Sneathiella glossodoripedis]
MELTQEFILQLCLYALIAFGLFCAVTAIAYWATFRGHNLSGESLSTIIAQTEIPKLITIILIIVSTTFLGLLQLVNGESVVAILSGIAGYVLGGQGVRRKEKPTSAPQKS